MTHLIVLAICSIAASIISLFVLIIASFEKKEKKEIDDMTSPKNKAVNTQVSSLLWTVVLGESVGLYFLFLFVPKHEIVPIILRVNALILLIASILCSALSILNAWYKKRMVIGYRLMFQSYSLIIAVLLLARSFIKGASLRRAVQTAGTKIDIITIFYFSSVVIALLLMFLDGLYRKDQRVEYDFNNYFRIVIYIGMIVGIGMLFLKWMLIRG